MKRITRDGSTWFHRVIAQSRGARDRSKQLLHYEQRSRLKTAREFLNKFLEGWETRNCDEFRWRRAGRQEVTLSGPVPVPADTRHTQRNRPPSRHRPTLDCARPLARAGSSHASHRYYNIRPVAGYFQPTVKIYPTARVRETDSMRRAIVTHIQRGIRRGVGYRRVGGWKKMILLQLLSFKKF